jgi:hypothetical protein
MADNTRPFARRRVRLDLNMLEQYANDGIDPDHGRLKGQTAADARTQRLPSAKAITAGILFLQVLGRGHYYRRRACA